jgi:hypothetical protein
VSRTRALDPVTSGPKKPLRVPPVRAHLGRRMVAAALSGGLAEGSQSTIYLQIIGGPQGSRTPDLRRANPDHSTPLNRTEPHGTTHLQGFFGGPAALSRRAPQSPALSLFVNGLSKRRSAVLEHWPQTGAQVGQAVEGAIAQRRRVRHGRTVSRGLHPAFAAGCTARRRAAGSRRRDKRGIAQTGRGRRGSPASVELL